MSNSQFTKVITASDLASLLLTQMMNSLQSSQKPFYDTPLPPIPNNNIIEYYDQMFLNHGKVHSSSNILIQCININGLHPNQLKGLEHKHKNYLKKQIICKKHKTRT